MTTPPPDKLFRSPPFHDSWLAMVRVSDIKPKNRKRVAYQMAKAADQHGNYIFVSRPTIAKALRVSPDTVKRHQKALLESGVLVRVGYEKLVPQDMPAFAFSVRGLAKMIHSNVRGAIAYLETAEMDGKPQLPVNHRKITAKPASTGMQLPPKYKERRSPPKKNGQDFAPPCPPQTDAPAAPDAQLHRKGEVPVAPKRQDAPTPPQVDWSIKGGDPAAHPSILSKFNVSTRAVVGCDVPSYYGKKKERSVDE